MSNYNSTLQSHNAELQSLLESINDLPQAGLDIETCSLSITNNTTYTMTLYYTDADGIHTLQETSVNVSCIVIKNSIVVINLLESGAGIEISCNDKVLQKLSAGYISGTLDYTLSFVVEDSMQINVIRGGADEPV